MLLDILSCERSTYNRENTGRYQGNSFPHFSFLFLFSWPCCPLLVLSLKLFATGCLSLSTYSVTMAQFFIRSNAAISAVDSRQGNSGMHDKARLQLLVHAYRCHPLLYEMILSLFFCSRLPASMEVIDCFVFMTCIRRVDACGICQGVPMNVTPNSHHSNTQCTSVRRNSQSYSSWSGTIWWNRPDFMH